MKTVFVSGLFNVLHPGHIRLLRFAKECGSRLIVGIQSDLLSGKTALIPENLRLESLKSISWVDEAFIFNEPIAHLIERLKPDIVVKGKEHEKKINPELSALDKYGGSLIFSSGEMIFSSIDLIQKEFQIANSNSIKLPKKYMQRHQIMSQDLIALLEKFTQLKICVVGDLIIDEYITCDSLGMSQEDPTIVVTPIDSTRFVGGAGIVALHAAGLGATVNFFSVTGNDTLRDYASEILSKKLNEVHLFVDHSRPTTLKQRYRSKGKSLLHVSHLHQEAISIDLQSKFLKELNRVMSGCNLLVFSDFNYGCLPQTLVDEIIVIAKNHGLILVADSQSSSQTGDISRFKDMDLITPTEREARISSHNREDGLVILSEQLRLVANAKNILLKLGEEGLLIHWSDLKNNTWLTDRISALNNSPKDVSGAGDSLLIVSAMTLACGGTIWEAACLGSLAAAIQVSRVGNTPLEKEDLIRELN